MYETARRTFAGTWNSAAAPLKALWSGDGAALADEPSVAMTSTVVAKNAETRERECVTRSIGPLLCHEARGFARREVNSGVGATNAHVCAPAT